MRPAALLLPVIALLAVACASPSSTPAPTTAPTPVVSPSVPVSPLPSVSPAPTPTPTPAAPTPAPSDEPSSTPTPTMTPDEQALIGTIRTDAAKDCVARRADLPDGALYGIECRPVGSPAARVGIYKFASRNEAAHAYMTRMASYGIDANAGDCNRGIPGDGAYTAGDGEGSIDDPGVFNWENSVLSPNRIGCFLDADGNANVRTTCDDVYIGVLGAAGDLSKLHDWTWRYPTGYEPGTPDVPGLCVATSAG